jgi:uncharacterized membrane protein
MPFCTQCGTPVDPQASFCHQCGAAQRPIAFGSVPHFPDSVPDRTASILCYIPVFGIIPAIIFLASQKFRSNTRVRFDAFQSVYLFLAWLVLHSVAPALFFAGFPDHGVSHGLVDILKLCVVASWIYLLVKAAQQQQVRLPVIGDLAARSAHEQL